MILFRKDVLFSEMAFITDSAFDNAFSKRIKIAQSSLARFESGRGNPTLSFLQKITKGLNLTLTVKPTHG